MSNPIGARSATGRQQTGLRWLPWLLVVLLVLAIIAVVLIVISANDDDDAADAVSDTVAADVFAAPIAIAA